MNDAAKLILNTVISLAKREPKRASKFFAADEAEVAEAASYLLAIAPGSSLRAEGKALVVMHKNGHETWFRVAGQIAEGANMQSDARIFPPTVTQGPPPGKQ